MVAKPTKHNNNNNSNNNYYNNNNLNNSSSSSTDVARVLALTWQTGWLCLLLQAYRCQNKEGLCWQDCLKGHSHQASCKGEGVNNKTELGQGEAWLCECQAKARCLLSLNSLLAFLAYPLFFSFSFSFSFLFLVHSLLFVVFSFAPRFKSTAASSKSTLLGFTVFLRMRTTSTSSLSSAPIRCVLCVCVCTSVGACACVCVCVPVAVCFRSTSPRSFIRWHLAVGCCVTARVRLNCIM